MAYILYSTARRFLGEPVRDEQGNLVYDEDGNALDSTQIRYVGPLLPPSVDFRYMPSQWSPDYHGSLENKYQGYTNTTVANTTVGINAPRVFYRPQGARQQAELENRMAHVRFDRQAPW